MERCIGLLSCSCFSAVYTVNHLKVALEVCECERCDDASLSYEDGAEQLFICNTQDVSVLPGARVRKEEHGAADTTDYKLKLMRLFSGFYTQYENKIHIVLKNKH